MTKKILLTFAGNTDPTRGDHDGPMIHICRYYRPEKIYLILTKEMAERDEEPYNIYERAIKANLKDYNFELIRKFTDIKDAHLFDAYFDIIYNTFEEIKRDEPNAEILVNVTSGTSQMTSNLISYIVDAIDMNIRALQVSTPERRSNTKVPVNKNYPVEESAENNFDNDEEYKTNRIIEPDLKRYSRVLIKNQIKERLKLYDYGTIYELLKRDIFEKNQELRELIKYAINRKNLKGEEVNKNLKNLREKKYTNLYYFKENNKSFKIPEWYKIVDYFALLYTEQQNKNISRYSLMLEPLSQNIYLSILRDIFNKNLNKILDYNKQKKSYEIDLSKLSEDMKNFIKNEMKILVLRDGNISNKFLAALIKYYLITEKELNEKLEIEYFDKLCGTLEKVKDIRNDLAHNMKNIDEKIFNNEVGTDTNNINHRITEFFEKYYQNLGYKKYMLFIYDEINKFIVEILEQEK